MCGMLCLQELAQRVSQSSAMRHWNELTIRAKQLEKQMPGLTGEAKEVRRAFTAAVQLVLLHVGAWGLCMALCYTICCHRSSVAHCAAAVLLMQAKQQEIEETQQQLADAQTALSDLQASFEPVSTTCTKQTCLCSVNWLKPQQHAHSS